ncbi:MAG: hypothetical protein OEW02_06520 [Myxococcales bacterium]|nr:hypothetical protein [Myxococcales bacterium]
MSSASPLRTAVCAASVVLLLAAPISAGEPTQRSLVTEGGLGAGAALLSIVYGPVKIAYAVVGLGLSGLGWMWTWGDSDVSGEIYRAALAGDWVVTPDHLLGKQDIEFSGK